MTNADLPAMPVPGLSHDDDFNGLTKRERFCIAMGVPATGDAELDKIIRAGVRQQHAALAMQGMLASGNWQPGAFSASAVRSADELLEELERTGGEL
ncbi:hypothetical protein HPA02_34910 [Bisbaumannia pacifica]|uniref:Uncharacterized protein n=1 Tax=Bisbaumannia pacifica TaxID=77098 RepID=A0A510XCR7_9GAMM|nr:hypothetical protein [Halomonas pacifica]GEK49208.1 hypothetical protein HPA02_34910 [Halomonas pacifica]